MSTGPTARTLDVKDLVRRAKDIWFPLLLLGVMGYIDYLTHGNILFVILVGGASLAVILFRGEIAKRIGLGDVLKGLPSWIRPVLGALPAMVWFMVRGQGNSGAGLLVTATTLVMVGGLAWLGPRIDQRLRGFYATRNRVLPRRIRMALAVVVPILVGFWVVHGTLAALPVLFHGTTSSPAYADGRAGLYLLATVLAGGIAFLLLREARSDVS